MERSDAALARQLDIYRHWPEPSKRDLISLQTWLGRRGHGDNFLAGRDEDVWDVEKGLAPEAFVGVQNTGDRISNNLTSWLIRLRRSVDRWRGVALASETDWIRSMGGQRYQHILNSVLTILASTMPVVPIVVLFLVDSLPVKVGLVFIFTLIVSAILTFGFDLGAERVVTITTA